MPVAGKMFVQELWRYPVKSLAGERLARIETGPLGFRGDRVVQVRRNGKVVTSRTDPRLLGLKGTGNGDEIRINGYAWDSAEALAMEENRSVRSVGTSPWFYPDASSGEQSVCDLRSGRPVGDITLIRPRYLVSGE